MLLLSDTCTLREQSGLHELELRLQRLHVPRLDAQRPQLGARRDAARRALEANDCVCPLALEARDSTCGTPRRARGMTTRGCLQPRRRRTLRVDATERAAHCESARARLDRRGRVHARSHRVPRATAARARLQLGRASAKGRLQGGLHGAEGLGTQEDARAAKSVEWMYLRRLGRPRGTLGGGGEGRRGGGGGGGGVGGANGRG